MKLSILEEPLAHVARDGRTHGLIEHLQGVATLAAEFGQKLGASDHARVAGLWHDIGKYSGDFQRMIREANGLEAHIETEGGPRDHSTAGALLAYQRGHHQALPIIFAIAGHHAGLSDFPDLLRRLKEKQVLLDNVLARSPDPSLLEISPPPIPFEASEAMVLRLESWTRMLFSALCDADFLDTERFHDASRAALRNERPTLESLAIRLRASLDDLEARTPATPVNIVRREVRQACISAAVQASGVYSLTVPTGGGKTLASLTFALEHAIAHGMERVVVVIPYTSIIEQTAAVYRNVLGEGAVLEHHSALDPEKENSGNRIACENWDAPVVVSTTVELFESLLANRPSRCRKLHRLARSVIVLDEAQALPGKLLPSILDVLKNLVVHFGTTVVVSTATQPAFRKSPILREGFEEITEICPPAMKLFDRLRRVRVVWPKQSTPTSYEALAEEVALEPSCLAIVHRRDDARSLCEMVDRVTEDETTHHLSALMTPQHRSELLAAIKTQTTAERPVRVVATQLVEAGVDLDFPVVFRAMAGLDSLAQAAGRCNREGRLASGELRVFHAPTEPPMGVLRTARDVAVAMRRAAPDGDMFSPEEQLRFFSELYQRTDLSRAAELQNARRQLLFRTVASEFRLIEDGWSSPLVIAHGEGAGRIATLRSSGISRAALRSLQRYTVNVPKTSLNGWIREGSVTIIHDTVAVLEGVFLAAYDRRFGLVPDRVGIAAPGAMVI